jgi:hypothetical protein
VDIVLRFQKLQDNTIRLEARIGELPLRRIQEQLASLGAEILEEIDRCTERQDTEQCADQPPNLTVAD